MLPQHSAFAATCLLPLSCTVVTLTEGLALSIVEGILSIQQPLRVTCHPNSVCVCVRAPVAVLTCSSYKALLVQQTRSSS